MYFLLSKTHTEPVAVSAHARDDGQPARPRLLIQRIHVPCPVPGTLTCLRGWVRMYVAMTSRPVCLTPVLHGAMRCRTEGCSQKWIALGVEVPGLFPHAVTESGVTKDSVRCSQRVSSLQPSRPIQAQSVLCEHLPLPYVARVCWSGWERCCARPYGMLITSDVSAGHS